MKKYLKDNKKIFKLINNKKYKILEIKPIRKIKRNGVLTNTIISFFHILHNMMI